MKSGPKCTQGIQNITDFVTDEFKKTQSGGDNKTALEILSTWESDGIRYDEFMYLFADAFAGMVQYGKRTQLCTIVEGMLNQDNMTQVQIAWTDLAKPQGLHAS